MAVCADWNVTLIEQKIPLEKPTKQKTPAVLWNMNYSHSFLSVGREAGGMQGNNNEEREYHLSG